MYFNKETEIGPRVAPKSSLLFQEFKIWQVLSNILIRKKGSRKRKVSSNEQSTLFEEEKEIFKLNLNAKETVYEELNLKDNLKTDRIIEILGYKPKDLGNQLFGN
ncbi:hypothetical protein [Myroides marinus]|uniref:hypothetical protein n=1 Tax=Myroides marinus TaxID=703342 RepID=UPI0025753BD4|nr:hypothetical protein [Myroides marinus]